MRMPRWLTVVAKEIRNRSLLVFGMTMVVFTVIIPRMFGFGAPPANAPYAYADAPEDPYAQSGYGGDSSDSGYAEGSYTGDGYYQSGYDGGGGGDGDSGGCGSDCCK